jgi:hypothetical protein
MLPVVRFAVLLLIAGGIVSHARGDEPYTEMCDASWASPSRDGDWSSVSDIKSESLFWVGVDAVWLSNDGGDFRSEILDPLNGAVSASQNLASGLTVAPRYRIGSRLFDRVSTEFIYFQSGDWESTADIEGTAATPELDATVDYTADLQNFELNFIGPQSAIDTQWLLGFRYLRYRDSFLETYQWQPAVGPAINEAASGSAENQAFGPQAGLGVNIDVGRNVLRFGSKLGLLNNRTDQTGPSYNNALVIDGTPEPTFRRDADEFLFLGDIEVSLTRYLTRNATLRIGYQGLYLDSVVQSSTQNGRQAEAGNLWFHGLVLGGEWIW